MSETSSSPNGVLQHGSAAPTSGPDSTGSASGLPEYVPESFTNDPPISRSSPTRKPRDDRKKKLLASERHAIAEFLSDAVSQAKALEAATSHQDPETAAICGMDLKQCLRQLWQLRGGRSADWATIINKLQVVTANIHFEYFTQEMATAVRLVLENHLQPDADNNDVRATTLLLQRAGLDPWAGIAFAGQ